MKRMSRTYHAVLRRAAGGLLALSLLAGLSPWAWAAPEEEPSAGNPSAEVPAREDPALPEENVPLTATEDEGRGESLADGPVTLSATEVDYPVTGGNLYFDTATGEITDCDYDVTAVAIPEIINGVSVASIGSSAFRFCNSLASVTIPKSVTTIKDYAFFDCNSLTNITIPDSVIFIGESAFGNCFRLTNIAIPDSVTSIGEDAFSSSTIENVYITDLTAWCSIDLGNSYSTPLYYGGKLYLNGELLTKLIIPDSVTSIGKYAFWRCSSLTTVAIPDSVTSIGEYAFEGCSMTNVTLGRGTTDIVEGVFENCRLTSITIPDSVTSIGRYAFGGCSSLTSVTIPKSMTTIRSDAFEGCRIQRVYITDLAAWCSIDFGNSYSPPLHYGGELYLYGERLTELVIPDNVIVIEDYAFSGCSSLINVTIPNSVTGIGYDAFSGCSSLTSVTIPDSVVSIRSDAFAGCSSLSSVTIPDSVIYIESGAFSDCSSLTSVTIASSVISIKNRAFYNCSNLTGVVFLGDAPNDVYSAGSSYSTFPSDVTLYYIAGKSGWTSPTWKGYKTVAITDADAPSEVHTDSYYASLPNYYFQFTDHTGRRLTGVTVTMNGQSFQSGTASSLEFACSGEGATVISKPGYHNVTLPGYLLCAYNEVTLYATGNSTPFVQTAYGSQNGGRSYCNLLSGGMTFYAGSLTEKTAFYIDVNWGSSGGGKVYLSQTLTPGDGVELSEGYNDAQNVSLQLKSSGRLYLLMVTGDGKIFSQSLAANILSASTSEDLNLGLGDTVDIPQPDNDFLSKFKFGVSLPNDIKVKMTVEPDGTVLAALGVELSEAKDVKTTVETIKDALYHADNYPKDWNSFVNALNGSIIPRSISFVVSANSDLVGYAEGKLIQKEDGTFDILFTEGKIAAKIEGKVQKTWQIYPLGIPFYVGGSIEPSVEFGIKLWSNEKEAEILIDPLEVEGKVPIKVRGGLGWDSIASAGIYGKGGITAEFTVPVSEEDLRVYVDASFGAEAKFFVFKADIEILKTEKFYLYGSPDDIPDIGVWMLDTSPMDWQPQSREYLYDTALMEVGEDDVQAGVQTVASGVYPYSDVQLAALGNGDLLAVCTADPGETARPEANNRTVLYYSIYTGSGWSSPAPVESQDDGTADFNPPADRFGRDGLSSLAGCLTALDCQ